MKRSILVLLAVLLILIGLRPVMTSAAADPYFLVVNDALPEPTVYNTPIFVNSITYVPCTVFDSQHTEVNLGVSYLWGKEEGIVTLYSGAKVLDFNLESGRVTDYPDRTVYDYQPAVIRNGIPYVPVAEVCNFFGLKVNFLFPEGCRIVRIKNGSEVIGDSEYSQFARSMLDIRISSFQAENNQSTNQDPVVNPPEEETPVTEDPGESSTIYVSILVERGDHVPAILSSLRDRRVKGIFFFSSDLLADYADAIIDIVNQGSRVGLIAAGDTGAKQLESIAAGDELLSHILHQRVFFILNAGLEANTQERLQQNGYILWVPQITIGAQGRGAGQIYDSALKQIKETATGRIRILFKSDIPAGTISSVLRQLKEEQYTFRAPRETQY